MPISIRKARASSSVFAVVTIEIFKPCILSIESKSISGIINGVDFEKGKLPYVTVGFYDGDSMIIPLDPVRAISMLSTKYVKEAQEAEIEEEV